jgi:hypothetical protein
VERNTINSMEITKSDYNSCYFVTNLETKLVQLLDKPNRTLDDLIFLLIEEEKKKTNIINAKEHQEI